MMSNKKKNSKSSSSSSSSPSSSSSSSSSSKRKRSTVAIKKRSTRKTRTKTRKPKYLSLRLQLSSQSLKTTKPLADTTETESMPSSTTTSTTDDQQLQLDENMAYLFSSADGGATTLTGLLGAATTTTTTSCSGNHRDALSPSASLTYAYCSRGHGGRDQELAKTALRNREREPSEEKWVRYSEVVERKDEEVSSSSAAGSGHDDQRCGRNDVMTIQRLSLKLDYDGILSAWCDKGPLYLHDESPPQTVPDMYDDLLPHAPPPPINSEVQDGWAGNVGLWRVPELTVSNGGIKEEMQVGEELWKVGQREASVLRYKEKRQNRLFSKRIRYEVRKLNAEKRPRLKGRFVKRD